MTTKAAVIVGVDKTGNLPRLTSAASGAEAVADWLMMEGYDVECLTDKDEPVSAKDVENAIAKFVTLPPRYNLLVVYFSGHGYWHARADCWLLSGAPTSTSEAINLDGAMDLARYSGIPNVVFISDACRSLPDSRTGARVTGIDLFPNYAEISNTSKIDVFRATSEARSAYEADIEGKQKSIMTHSLMLAYKEPEPNMIREVKDGTAHVQVVPNRELESYLQNKVNEILANININLTQTIEANVPSSDDIYIARVQTPLQPISSRRKRSGGGVFSKARALESSPAISPGRDAANTIFEMLNSPRHETGERLTVSCLATEKKLEKHLPNKRVDRFETMAGFTVQGAKVVKAVTTKGYAVLLEEGDGNGTSAIIRLATDYPAVSVVILLEDGRSAVLAGLKGYIGHANFDKAGLSNVSYVPSANHWRWSSYINKKTEVDRLRAMTALAVENNTFQIRSDTEADALGRTIRVEKAIDPTLGLYAAHSFSQAGRDSSVLSVLEYMRGDLNADLFDVWALASRCIREPWNIYPLAPFCPMLTQTWNLLRPRGIILPPVLQEAMPYLCNSLWTTFQPEVNERIMQAIETGELQ